MDVSPVSPASSVAGMHALARGGTRRAKTKAAGRRPGGFDWQLCDGLAERRPAAVEAAGRAPPARRRSSPCWLARAGWGRAAGAGAWLQAGPDSAAWPRRPASAGSRRSRWRRPAWRRAWASARGSGVAAAGGLVSGCAGRPDAPCGRACLPLFFSGGVASAVLVSSTRTGCRTGLSRRLAPPAAAGRRGRSRRWPSVVRRRFADRMRVPPALRRSTTGAIGKLGDARRPHGRRDGAGRGRGERSAVLRRDADLVALHRVDEHRMHAAVGVGADRRRRRAARDQLGGLDLVAGAACPAPRRRSSSAPRTPGTCRSALNDSGATDRGDLRRRTRSASRRH